MEYFSTHSPLEDALAYDEAAGTVTVGDGSTVLHTNGDATLGGWLHVRGDGLLADVAATDAPSPRAAALCGLGTNRADVAMPTCDRRTCPACEGGKHVIRISGPWPTDEARRALYREHAAASRWAKGAIPQPLLDALLAGDGWWGDAPSPLPPAGGVPPP